MDRIDGGVSSFLLGGRAWAVERVDHSERAVRVKPAVSGQKPSWGAFLPQLLGFEVCQQMRRVLVEDIDYPYLHPSARAALRERREELGPLLGRAARPVQVEAGVARWWTFAGGRVNHTLKYGLEVLGGWKVVADNVQLRIEGDGVTHGTVDAAADRMGRDDFWEDEVIWRNILARLPPYRLSKFQGVLPEPLAVEMGPDTCWTGRGRGRTWGRLAPPGIDPPRYAGAYLAPGIAGIPDIAALVTHAAAAVEALVIASASPPLADAMSPALSLKALVAAVAHAASLQAQAAFSYSSAAMRALLLPQPLAARSIIEPKHRANAALIIFILGSP